MPLPLPGETAPAFRASTSDGRTIDSDELAGGYTTLCFFGSTGHPAMADMVALFTANDTVFDGVNHRLIGVSIDPADESEGRLPSSDGAVRMVRDFDCALSRLFGAIDTDDSSDAQVGEVQFQPLTVLLDPGLRVLSVHRIDDPADHPARLLHFLQSLPAIGPPKAAVPQAPVLLVPMVFEVELCRQLVALFDKTGGQPSGVFEDVEGQTVLTIDPARKQRLDAPITDGEFRQTVHARIQRRLLPEIRKAFQFEASKIERSVVARYDVGDFCGPHRDNQTLGTAHRQIAVSIPLNTDAFAGGLYRFPEYGRHLYYVPTGCALVHSCSLLHDLTPVTEGARYAFIPILFNEQASKVLEANTRHLAPTVRKDRREFQTGD